MSTPLGNEIDRIRAVNDRLMVALRIAHSAIEAALAAEVHNPDNGFGYCPRCGGVVRLIDDGETCCQCKLVL